MGNKILFTGGFDPIHSGHISVIKEAQKLGEVILGLNSDEWLRRKKGKEFLSFNERKSILDEFKNIVKVIEFDDSDDSACNAIQKVLDYYPNDNIIFVNGGDRIKSNIPEIEKFKDNPRVKFKFKIGGDIKKNSSSWILKNWINHTEKRVWGDSITYHESNESKVKRLIIEPNKSISMQYHNNRNEFWFVEEGLGKLTTLENDQEIFLKFLEKHTYFHVPKGVWHKLYNNNNTNLEIIEIQYGEKCSEIDIIRK